MKLLIVSTMKPMIEDFAIEQYNAIRSWQRLRLKPEIIIFGDDQGVAEFCETYQIRNIKEVKKNKKGVPLINDILKQSYNLCEQGTYVAYINADILLMDDFCDTLIAFDNKYPNCKSCLLTAIRSDVFKYHKLKFERKDRKGIKPSRKWRKDVKENFMYQPCAPTAIDIFVHKRGNYAKMPDFAIARLLFDSWMLDYAIKYFEIVVNMTSTVKIWHHLGNWYQNGKIVPRDWNRVNEVMDVESVEENKRLGKDLKFTLITQCPFISYFDSGIQFKDRFFEEKEKLKEELIIEIEKFYRNKVKDIENIENKIQWIDILSIDLIKQILSEFKTKNLRQNLINDSIL